MRKAKINFDLSAEPIRPLPHSRPLEQLVLAQIIREPDNYRTGFKFLKADGLFYESLNGRLWTKIRGLMEASGKLSYQQLRASLLGEQERELYRHCSEVHGCYEQSNFLHNCLRLNEYWISRLIHQTGYYLNQHALSPVTDPLSLLGEASDKLGTIYRHIVGVKEKTLADGIDELQAEQDKMQQNPGGVPGLKSSIHGVNRVVGGYKRSSLIVIGAATHEGKTTLAVQEARHLIEQGIPVGYISLEMKTSELVLMMACDALGLDSNAVQDGKLTPEEKEAFNLFLAMMRKRPFHVNDTPGLRVGEIKAIARSWVKQQGIQVLYIDHLHLVYDDVDQSNPEQRFTNVANSLKELAKELDIPVIPLAQLARKDVTAKGVHQITDLKYAGGIEQAADVILLIFRPVIHGITKNANGEEFDPSLCRIIVGKLRLRPKEDILCHFTGNRFVDWDDYNHGLYRKPTVQSWAGIAPAFPDRPSAGIRPSYASLNGYRPERNRASEWVNE